MCGETKDEDAFNWRRKARGQRDNMCRTCRAAYKQAHDAANKQRYIDNADRLPADVASAQNGW